MPLLKKINQFKFFLLLIFLWVFAAFFINPNGEFPLNDDWAFSFPIKSYYETGILKFNIWAPMTLIGQIFYGLIFTEVFGYSFTVLRCSMVVAGLVGVLFVFTVLKQVGATEKLAFFCSLVIAFNPIYLCLSYTFMTDILFFTTFLIAVYFYFKELNTHSINSYLGAIAFSIIAISVRQTGIVLPLAFCFTIFIKDKGLKNYFYATVPFLVSIVLLLLYEKYIRYQIGYPSNFPDKNTEFLSIILNKPLRSFLRQILVLIKTFQCIGLLLIPLSILLFYNLSLFKNTKRFLVIDFCFSIILTFILHFNKPESPFSVADILNQNGIGPKIFYDTFYLNQGGYYLNFYIWKIISFISFFSAFILISYFVIAVQKVIKEEIPTKSYHVIFASTLILIYLPLMTMLSFFDRYLLPVFVLLLIIIVSIKKYNDIPQSQIILSTILLFLFVLFSVLGTSTYLNWNRARWKAADYLTKTLKISPTEIDGGFEFNAYYYYHLESNIKTSPSWWVSKKKYMLSFSKISDYKVIKKFYYEDKLLFKKKAVLVSKK